MVIKDFLRPILKPLLVWYYSIGSSKCCNLCGWKGHAFRRIPRPEKSAPVDLCPQCGSQARHRLASYLLKGKLGEKHRTIHSAPERFAVPWLQSISDNYLSIDLDPNLAMRKMDLTSLELEDESVTLFWCSHVLEHIENDTKAMSEIYRVLMHGSKAIIMVPVYGVTTYEDFSIQAPEERLEHFNQRDHVRLYGMDIVERLKGAGFEVKVLDLDGISDEDIKRYCLDWPVSREVFVCKRP